MTPSNPATCFVDGNRDVPFVYAPGPDPYYIIVRSKSCIHLSTMVFAKDAQHARDILVKMLDFRDACAAEYTKREKDRDDRHDLRGRDYRRTMELRKALAGDKGFSVHIGPADRGQMYKIGWASNDNF